MSWDMEEEYDKIYRYCYFNLGSRETAEDVTQETFLRYLEHYSGLAAGQAQKYLYTIARNLCTDEFRKPKTGALEEAGLAETIEDRVITNLAVRKALAGLTSEEQELLLLRYVNEVSVSMLGKIYGLSRFAVYRRLKAASGKFREALGKEVQDGSLEE